MNLPFSLPAPSGYSDIPKWDGMSFVFDGHRTPVLEYSENFAGWSDDLTTLHEEVAGENHPIDLASRKHAIEQVKRVLPSNPSVIMEIGCSSGFLIKDLVKIFPESTIVGTDVVKLPLYKLATDLPGVPLIRFDLLKCPLPERSIDILVMLNVLEHIEDDIHALKNAFKLLKPGGSLIIEVPAAPYLYDAYDAELMHYRRYSIGQLLSKLKLAGFIVSEKTHLGFIVFPAFFAMKLFNKLLHSKKNSLVKKQASITASSKLLHFLINLESKIFKHMQLPFGIRILITAKKIT